MIYTTLERRFDALTPAWIVSTGRLINMFGKSSRFSCSVAFKGKKVRKASVADVNGVRTWRQFETATATPDFVVMSDEAYAAFSAAERRCRKGLEYVDPFRALRCKTGWYVELLGDYWHSGPFVQGLSKEEHEKEMREAYASAGANVLLLWEDEVVNRWGDVCEPKLRAFLAEAARSMNLPSECVSRAESENGDERVWKSLADASYWRTLPEDEQDGVIDSLCSLYDHAGFPYPDRHMALSDFRRFCSWGKKRRIRKPSRFGMNCCRHFCKSMSDANSKGKPSLGQIWADKDLMRKSIRWQLENENGSHHAKRFLNAMCHRVGFRVVANMRPAVAALWASKYGKPNGVWFDPCAGWGGRMLAAHVLGMKYVAVDANRRLVEELNEMADVLGIDAAVSHGNSADEKDVASALEGGKADLVFTSPPFFDSEHYSDDGLQSVAMFPKERDWHERFFGPLIENSLSVLGDDGVLLLNIGMKQRLDWTGVDLSAFAADDFDIQIGFGSRTRKERLLRVDKGSRNISVQCSLCGRLFSEIGSHMERMHGISLDEYRNGNPDAEIVRKKRARPSGLKYKARKAYRLPDGSYVRRKDAWLRAWGPDGPPDGSAVDASTVREQDDGKVECKLCGHRGHNLTRHLRGKHGIEPEDYEGEVKSERCKENLSRAARRGWDKRGRKPPRDKSENRTHKQNGLDEETLKRLKADGLSDAKIGKMFGMTGEGVAYRRKKWGVEPLGSWMDGAVCGCAAGQADGS